LKINCQSIYCFEVFLKCCTTVNVRICPL